MFVSPGIMPVTVKATVGLDVMSIVPAANVPVDAAVSVKIASEMAPAPSAEDGQAQEGGQDAAARCDVRVGHAG